MKLFLLLLILTMTNPSYSDEGNRVLKIKHGCEKKIIKKSGYVVCNIFLNNQTIVMLFASFIDNKISDLLVDYQTVTPVFQRLLAGPKQYISEDELKNVKLLRNDDEIFSVKLKDHRKKYIVNWKKREFYFAFDPEESNRTPQKVTF